jgi:hypothetical protein
MNKFVKPLFLALSVAVIGAATTASADPGQQDHPRRAEVNHRLNHLNHRIRHERREGELTAGEAHRLHHRVHQIRVEERRMARHHHGHITRGEQARLNHQENAVSQKVGK